jgi:hypothetical protein
VRVRPATLVVTFACSLIVAACGGGGGGRATVPVPAPSAAAQAGPTADVHFRIVVPSASSTSARLRRPAYISSSTASATIAVSSNGTTAASTTVSCTTTCSGTIAAPIGSDTFTVNLYDGAGSLLSTGALTQTITAGEANSVNVTFNGVVSSLSLRLSATTLTVGTSTQVTVTFRALDADANAIVGPGGYVSASGAPLTIALGDSDQSGATSLSTTTLSTPPTQPITLAYSGTAIADPTITASAGTVTASASLGMIQTFASTGALQTFTVPAGVASVTIAAVGAGGAGGTGGSGGAGAALTGTFAQSAGAILPVIVGGTHAADRCGWRWRWRQRIDRARRCRKYHVDVRRELLRRCDPRRHAGRRRTRLGRIGRRRDQRGRLQRQWRLDRRRSNYRVGGGDRRRRRERSARRWRRRRLQRRSRRALQRHPAHGERRRWRRLVEHGDGTSRGGRCGRRFEWRQRDERLRDVYLVVS